SLFAVTSWLILLLAAGMAAQAANYLVRAGLLPPLGRGLWDTSWLLSQDSLVGKLLHTLVGYVDRPSGIQLLAYIATLVIIGGALRLWGRPGASPRPPARATATAWERGRRPVQRWTISIGRAQRSCRCSATSRRWQ